MTIKILQITTKHQKITESRHKKEIDEELKIAYKKGSF